MAREVDASHAMNHPFHKERVLLLRQTTNPGDPAGAFAVLKVITRVGYQKHYSGQCQFIEAKPYKVLKNQQDEIDAVLIRDVHLDDRVIRSRQEARASMTIPADAQPDPATLPRRSSSDAQVEALLSAANLLKKNKPDDKDEEEPEQDEVLTEEEDGDGLEQEESEDVRQLTVEVVKAKPRAGSVEPLPEGGPALVSDGAWNRAFIENPEKFVRDLQNKPRAVLVRPEPSTSKSIVDKFLSQFK